MNFLSNKKCLQSSQALRFRTTNHSSPSSSAGFRNFFQAPKKITAITKSAHNTDLYSYISANKCSLLMAFPFFSCNPCLLLCHNSGMQTWRAFIQKPECNHRKSQDTYRGKKSNEDTLCQQKGKRCHGQGKSEPPEVRAQSAFCPQKNQKCKE